MDRTTSSLPDIGQLRLWAAELGFASLGVADLQVAHARPGYEQWLADGFHGEMDYMVAHRALRFDAAQLVPAAASAIMTTIAYAPNDAQWLDRAWRTMADDERAYVSRYALGRDYHKVVRARLNKLAARIERQVGPFTHRPFCDSAPVLEVELARKAGLGWRGKHTLLLNREQGSMFFIGSLYTSLVLCAAQGSATANAGAANRGAANDGAAADGEHCGQCRRCIDACPTGAIVAPYRLDARRCISYLTIESKRAIPLELRAAIGNRIYGCDDCQLACPWNKFAQSHALADFAPRQDLDSATLVTLFGWTEEQFAKRTAGSAIARIGHERWLRNIAVALGNALRTVAQPGAAEASTAEASTAQRMRAALTTRLSHPSELVREHVQWALAQEPA